MKSADGQEVAVDKMFVPTGSPVFDAVFIPGGRQCVDALKQQGAALHVVEEAFKHCKAIGAAGEGAELLREAHIDTSAPGAVTAQEAEAGGGGAGADGLAAAFVEAIAQHRHWARAKDAVPA